MGLRLLFLVLDLVSGRKRGSWEVPSALCQMDPSSPPRHLRKTEAHWDQMASLGKDLGEPRFEGVMGWGAMKADFSLWGWAL